MADASSSSIAPAAAVDASLLRRERLALLATSSAFFMVILDTSIVNLAIPRIAGELGAGLSGMQWIIDGYALVLASLLLTAGTLGDRYGAKRIFLCGLILFTVASALCGVARSLAELEAARTLQGVGAALQLPTSLALLNHAVREPTRRTRAVAGWAAAGAIGIATGPIVGGVLVEAFGWRSIFLANLPVGLSGAVVAWRAIADTPAAHGRALDLAGQLLAVAALALATYAVIEGGRSGLSREIIAAGLGTALLVLAFLAVESRAAEPMLPLSFFRRGAFSATVAIGLLHNFGVYGQIFVLSLAFQSGHHEMPVAAGLSLLPLTVSIAAGVRLGGRVVARFGAMALLTAGHALACLGALGLAAAGLGVGSAELMCLLVPMGIGIGVTTPAMNLAALDSLGRERSGLAAGALNTGRQIGGVFGVAVLGALLGSPLTDAATQRAFPVAGLALGLAALCAFAYLRRPSQSAQSPQD
jgi:DHA2 family methylenomycin A resistance protein-like MFS transporter